MLTLCFPAYYTVQGALFDEVEFDGEEKRNRRFQVLELAQDHVVV